MAITGLGKGLKGFGENFLNTYLAMQQLGMRKEEMKRQAETDKSLEEKRKLDRMMKEMQYDQMQKQIESQTYEKEHIYIPWFRENFEGSEWGDIPEEAWGRFGYGTLKKWYEKAMFGMKYSDDDDAWKWIQKEMRDKTFARQIIKDARIVGILPDGSKYIYHDSVMLGMAEKALPNVKNLKTEKDFEEEKALYVSGEEAEIKPESVVLETSKPGHLGMKYKKEPVDYANDLARNAEVKKWASYNYLGNGKFRPGSKTDFEMKWGNKYGVSWTLFKGLIGQTGLFPVEPPKKKYKKKETKTEESEGWHTRAVSKAESQKKMKAEIEATKKELTNAGATPKEIRIVIMDIKKRYKK